MNIVRIGQIGVGNWGKNLLRNFDNLTGCKVVSVCDSSPEVLERIATDYPEQERTTNPEEIINHPEIDGVVVATPPVSHYDLASRSILAGKEVFVEKPMVLNKKDGERLVKLAEENDRILMVGHLMEYHPAVLKLKEYIDHGDLGKIYYIYSNRINLGQVRKEENALWSFAPHDISVALFLLGEEPISVTAVGRSYLRPGIEDVAFAILNFKDNAMAHMHVSWLDPHKIRKLTVVGSKKMAVFDDMDSSEPIRIFDKGVDLDLSYESYGDSLTLRWGDILIPRIKITEPLRIECQHFIDCVRDHKQPLSDGKDGLRVVQVLEAAQESMKNGGKPVNLNT